MPMNPAVISALAALGGSAVGALAPVWSNYVFQKGLTERDLLNRQLAQREALYADFIKEASRLYAESLIHSLEDLHDLVSLYAHVGRIRLLASTPVVKAAEDFVKLIVRHYGEDNLTVEQMRAAALATRADPLEVFSSTCRKELRDILQKGQLSATIVD